MSFTACAWAFKVRDLQPSHRHVLLVLANYADERGMCWPSQRHLAAATGYSERTIRTALGALEDEGYIDRRGRRDDEQAYRSDEIYLLMPEEMIDANPKMKPSGKSFRSQRQNRQDPAANDDRSTGNDFRSDRKQLPESQRQQLPPILSDSTLSDDPIRDTDDATPSAAWPRDAFDQFWNKFPNKVGKGAARTAFARVEKSGIVTFERLMEGLDAYVNKKDDRPWCIPTTFLNQERWDDQPQAGKQFANLHSEVRAMKRVAI